VSHNTRVLIAENDLEFDKLAAKEAVNSNTEVDSYKRSLRKAIAGTPEQCVEQIMRYVDRGITYFFLLFPDPIPSESLSLFAQEVMPHFDQR
jgi:alkanesulfonate monooxygenase SsuD/methylene tetrahydromethanopterin reductase-like flavin-dependent oxidoreductase (luciferase family)